MTDRTVPLVSARKRTVQRVLAWLGAALLVLLICAFVAGEIVLHRAAPILKAKVLETLSARFDSRVELDNFEVSLVRGLNVSGGGLRLYPTHLDGSVPLFSIQRFSFFTNWKQLFRSPMYIDRVHVEGLAIHLPPKEQRPSLPHMSTGNSGHIKIAVGQVLCDDATLVLGTSKPGKVPLEFDIHKLQLETVGVGQPMKFHAMLVNPKPVGDIDTSGYFGPFDADSPGDSALRGDYTFKDADLGPLKGIGGTLSSIGSYEGTLNDITVDGETTTPDFQLDRTARPVPLNTKFHAIVDGTNGDTHLEPVDAWLLHSHIVAKGDVVRATGQPGHDISLDVEVGPARIEDILELGAKAETPILNGDLKMHTTLHLPPGDVPVIQKLHLAGAFALLNAHFSNRKFQSAIDQLSLRGQGKAKEATEESNARKKGDAGAGQEGNIASTIRGDFALGDGKITLHKMEYQVPGATIAVDGAYTLEGQGLDFSGAARLDAKISQMVTGWKSLLLKPIDPFFAKDGSGTEVPIHVTGTRTDPQIGLEFGGKEHELKPKITNSGGQDTTNPKPQSPR